MVEFEVRSVRYAAEEDRNGDGVATPVRLAHIMVSCPACFGVFPVVRSLEEASFRCSCDYCDVMGRVTLRRPESG